MMTAEVLARLRERRGAVWEEARLSLEAAAEDMRSLTADEAARFDRLMAELDQIDRRMAATSAPRPLPAAPVDLVGCSYCRVPVGASARCGNCGAPRLVP